MTMYVLFNSEMYNSILGRSVLIFTIILLTTYNVMLGLGLVVLIIYMYPNGNYLEGLTVEPDAAVADAAKAKAVDAAKTDAEKAKAVATVTTDAEKAKAVAPAPAAPAPAAPAPAATTITTDLAKKTSDLMNMVMAKPESFTNNNNQSNDRISKEERLRPKTSVTTNLYPERGMGVSTTGYAEPSPNNSNGSNSLGFAFLS